jgi:hypothetical protein
MEKALNNNFVISGIRKLGENMNKEAILYRMNAKRKSRCGEKMKKSKVFCCNFFLKTFTQLEFEDKKSRKL